MIRLKNEKQIDGIRKSCKLLAHMFEEIIPKVEPGMSTKDIDDLAVKFIKSNGGKPAWYTVDFPGALCISVNNEVSETAVFTINKYSYELSGLAFSKAYLGTDPALETTVTLNGEEVKVTLSRESGETVGTYDVSVATVTIDDVDATNNYTITVPADNNWFTINDIASGLYVKVDGSFEKT